MGAAIRVYVAVFLFRDDHVLLLRRSKDKTLASGLWTGVGGRVEPEEMDDVERAALREIHEETGILPEEVRDLRIRVVFTQPEEGDISILVFCTGSTDRVDLGPCEEGDLQWIELDRVKEIPLIENAARALEFSAKTKNLESHDVQFGICIPQKGGDPLLAISPDLSSL